MQIHQVWWPDEIGAPLFDGSIGERKFIGLNGSGFSDGVPSFYDVGHDVMKVATQTDINAMMAACVRLSEERSILREERDKANAELSALRTRLAERDASLLRAAHGRT